MNIPHQLPHLNERLHLAFVTDGEFAQVIGIISIINSFIDNDEEKNFCHSIWLLTPQQNISKLSEQIETVFGKQDFRYLAVDARNDDKYFVQVGFAQLFDLIDLEAAVICMDYDHIVLNPSGFPFAIPNDGVRVSSEVYADFDQQLIYEQQAETSVDLPEKHLNASFIYGRAAELRNIGKHWFSAYEDLSFRVQVRHRVELAFSLAAKRARVLALPCPTSIQGNFALPNTSCCIFHYGGESKNASRMKSILYTEAAKIQNSPLKKYKIRHISDLLTQELLILIENED